MKFVLRPDPDHIAAASRQFIINEGLVSRSQLHSARTKLDEIERQLDANPTEWWLTSDAARAEELYEAARILHQNNLMKLSWETRRQWARVAHIHPAARPAPWNTEPDSWAKNFVLDPNMDLPDPLES